ncbi:MAG: hypothetical protein LBJ94_02925 [Puniceicoccales bacterium]|jgi:hypothetical protein|nr:hypothetical protein [Puniceicoccales bacterium]
MSTSDITSVVQAIETQTKAISQGLPDKEFYAELQKAITANTSNSEVNSNAIRVLLEEINSANKTTSSEEAISEKFFRVVKGVQEHLEDLRLYVEGFSRRSDISAGDLFEMQFKITQFSIAMDISSKMGEKSSQCFQTLFRNQG